MNEVLPPATQYEREITAVDSNALALIARQEIDVQIATAHQFPRSVVNFRSEVGTMATLNDSVASECSYALPRDGKVIEGPSVRFAEILLSSWGNCRAAARVVNEDSQFITAQGMFHDLQKNSAVVFEVRRRITNKHGRRYNDDMIVTAGNAASSIALRNAILKGIPKAFWADLWEQSRKTAKGDHKTLTNRRADALKVFQGYGVTAEKVFAFLHVRGIEEINLDHLVTLRGLATAFKDGEATPEEVFPDATAAKPAAKPIADQLDDFAKEDSTAAAASEPAAAPAGQGEGAVASHAEPPAASPASTKAAASSAEVGAGDADLPDNIRDAKQRGRAARLGGLDREAPKIYSRKKAEADAFVAGWDEADQKAALEDYGTV